MKAFTESYHARECQKEEGNNRALNWNLLVYINRTVYSPEKYLALYHESCYVPKPRISSVKTPGSLSIKHHSPPPDAMMLNSTTQRSVPEVVLLRLVPRVVSSMILPPDLETWKPTTLNIQDGECNDSLGSLYNEAKNISLFLQCGVSRCISYSKISCVSKKIAQRG